MGVVVCVCVCVWGTNSKEMPIGGQNLVGAGGGGGGGGGGGEVK